MGETMCHCSRQVLLGLTLEARKLRPTMNQLLRLERPVMIPLIAPRPMGRPTVHHQHRLFLSRAPPCTLLADASTLEWVYLFQWQAREPQPFPLQDRNLRVTRDKREMGVPAK